MIWITWEHQRRSIELSKELDCALYILEYNGLFRYPKCIAKTVKLIIKNRPAYLFVQNPSMVLATLATLLKFFLNYTLVVDRHSSFRVGKQYKNKIDNNFFLRNLNRVMNKFTVKYADTTIITNRYLAELVSDLGGNPFILPDKVPSLHPTKKLSLVNSINILMISSCHSDEPFSEVFEAMRLCKEELDIKLFITGNEQKLPVVLRNSAPENVTFTGFVSEDTFTNLLFSVDIIMVLTTSEYTMLCGCYECVAAEKPLITSNKNVLTDYFDGAYFVENGAKSIRDGILNVSKDICLYRKNTVRLKNHLEKSWESNFQNLKKSIEEI